jgi:hypothetical protein
MEAHAAPDPILVIEKKLELRDNDTRDDIVRWAENVKDDMDRLLDRAQALPATKSIINLIKDGDIKVEAKLL